MTEEKRQLTSNDRSANSANANKGRARRGGARRGQREGGEKELEQKMLDLSRVTRVTAGGKRMSFRAAIVVGDRKGHVGFGVAKGADVQIAVEKAYRQAKKILVTVPIENGTIPHAVELKFHAAHIILMPAPKGTGLKSGGSVRVILELAGVPNATSKVLNSSNKINLASATMEALKKLRPHPQKVAAE